MKKNQNFLKATMFAILFFLTNFLVHAQMPGIQWKKCFGGTYTDGAYDIKQTMDGGYIIAGATNSNDIQVVGNHGDFDFWVVKVNLSGIIEWAKCFGGAGLDYGISVDVTSDGGYIVGGITNSMNGDVTGYHSSPSFSADCWIVKLDAAGNIVWQKCLGGSSEEYFSSIKQTSDGGYLVVGASSSMDGDVTGNHGLLDYWIIKIDATGEIEWQKSFGGSDMEFASSADETIDGGYIVAGYSLSNNGDVTANHGLSDYWIVKLTTAGEIEWQKSLGGSGYEEAHSVQQTFDGGYIVAGYTTSSDGDVVVNHGDADYWIVKLNSTGSIQWKKGFGGNYTDIANSIEQTPDGGYIIAGYTVSTNGQVKGNHGSADYWIVRLNSMGKLLWSKCLGGSEIDEGQSITQTTDGGYVVCGYALSSDGNVGGNHGNVDMWVIKFSPEPSLKLGENKAVFGSMYPNPTPGLLFIDLASCPKEEGDIEIYSLAGQLVLQKHFGSNTDQVSIDLCLVPTGTYLVKIRMKDTVLFSKIMKE